MQGVGVSTFEPEQKMYPIVNGADAARNSASKDNARHYSIFGSSSIPNEN